MLEDDFSEPLKLIETVEVCFINGIKEFV